MPTDTISQVNSGTSADRMMSVSGDNRSGCLGHFAAADVVGVCLGDRSGNLVKANDEMLRILGYSPEDFASGHLCWHNLTPLEYWYLDELALSETKVAGRCVPYEKALLRKGGGSVPVMVGHSLASKDAVDIVTFVLDLSEVKRTESEREKLLAQAQSAQAQVAQIERMRDEFLATLSHELRTPLSPILGWSKLLQKGQLSEEKTAIALNAIEKNAQHQSQLVDDLLDSAHILFGKVSLRKAPMDLSQAVTAAVDAIYPAANAKEIAITTEISPCMVLGDAARLQQIVRELLANAVKFTPRSGNISVTLTPAASSVRLLIADTGKGIGADFLPYAFDHFRQEDCSTSRQFGGLGLGLATVRQLVKMHDGQIFAESKGEDAGTRLVVDFPLLDIGHDASATKSKTTLANTAASTETIAEASVEASTEESEQSQCSVLLVDDDDDSLEITSFALEQAGVNVISVNSGAAALEALKVQVPALLISDVGMPEMDGYMLIRKIRQLPAEEGGKVVAIALTAYASEYDSERCIDAGFQRHLSKPIDPDVLVQVVSELVGL